MDDCDKKTGLRVVETKLFLDEWQQQIEGGDGPMQRAVRAGDNEQWRASGDKLVAFDGAQRVGFEAE